MSILAKKSEPNNLINTEEKNDNFLEITEYKENLEFEVLETFSDKISDFIGKNDYQKVIEFTEKQLYLLNQAFTDESEKIKIQNTDFHFELPLKRKNSDIIGNINELIINEKVKFRNFFIYLKQELLSCKKFYFIVSFIKYSGIQLLISTLDELEKQGIQGEIITSVYLNITDSKALRKLLSYKNIKVKIYNNSSESFHTKAYLFEKEKYHSVIIGSSNISQSALYSAEEWNVKLTDSNFFNIYEIITLGGKNMGLINYFEEKRLERERAIRNEQVIDSLKFLASIGAGFTLGVLFAKKSGKETRKDISNATKEGLNYVGKNLNNAKNYVKDKANNMKEAVAEKYDELKNETIPEKIEDFKEKVEDTADNIEEKAENVKEKIKK